MNFLGRGFNSRQLQQLQNLHVFCYNIYGEQINTLNSKR